MSIICNFKIKNSIYNVSRELILHEKTSFLDLHLLMSELFSFAGYHPFIFTYNIEEKQYDITIEAENIETPLIEVFVEKNLITNTAHNFMLLYSYGINFAHDEHGADTIFWEIMLDLDFQREVEQQEQLVLPFCIEAEGISPSEQMRDVKEYDTLRQNYESDEVTEKKRKEIAEQFIQENKYFCMNHHQHLDTTCFDVDDLNKTLHLFFSKRQKILEQEKINEQDVFADFTEEQAAFMKLYVQTLESIFLSLAHTGYDEATIFAMIQGEIALDDHIYQLIEDDLDILQSLPTWDSMFTKDDEERLKKLELSLLKQWEEKDDKDLSDPLSYQLLN